MGGRSDKETQILEAAARLFARFGPRKTTIDDIAREAGLGKGTIYLYFDRKEEIFSAYVRGRCEEFHAAIAAKVALETSAERKIRAFLSNRLRLVAEHLTKMGVTPEAFREVRALPELDALKREFLPREHVIVGKVLEDGIASGELTIADPALAAVAICAAAEALAEPWVVGGGEVAWETKANTLADLIVNGLKR